MAKPAPASLEPSTVTHAVSDAVRTLVHRAGGAALVLLAIWLSAAFLTFSISDPTLNNATGAAVQNAAGPAGAVIADAALQMLGAAALLALAPLFIWGGVAAVQGAPDRTARNAWMRAGLFPVALIAGAGFAEALPVPAGWPYVVGVGGLIGQALLAVLSGAITFLIPGDPHGPIGVAARHVSAAACGALMVAAYFRVCGLTPERAHAAFLSARKMGVLCQRVGRRQARVMFAPLAKTRREPTLVDGGADEVTDNAVWTDDAPTEDAAIGGDSEFLTEPLHPSEPGHPPASHPAGPATKRNIIRDEKAQTKKRSKRALRDVQPELPVFSAGDYEFPPLSLLAKPKREGQKTVSDEALEQNARMLETVLADFGVRGEIINVRPGPVVTLYELEPAAGVKSSRVIGLADDIARSMSAVAARVAVVPGRNAIGIELPNQDREMVFVRELLETEEYDGTRGALTLALGKSIGGEPVYADLAKMPHLLIAGTTGSGKSVGVNTMILSLLYRLSPDLCKLIMIDPKMLELSVYEGIPHLLSPVVTDPRKAVVALKWTVREMEERYKRMSKVGVRNITGFNQRIAEADDAGEMLTRRVHTGYDAETGEPVYETEELDYEAMPYIVVVIDEVADLMMVAGKDIEAMVQRLAQMARAAGIHLIMATQRPSVDVITGTIKANFPTRISFQVTSKIDSRTILGEQGAEQLLGQGDMLHMAGGGRIKRVHGGFVADDEVEKIVAHLKKQGKPEYVQAVTELDEEGEGADLGLDIGGNTSSGDALYDKAVAVVLRDRKASTSYVQRRLQIGYNRAATLIERMEDEGVISPANHAGKREILIGEDAA
ncbi:MAG: DNA translocase FtsK 4TM domain-containing protein [Pseudomonadota bacterium]